jgi:hypothetical protein
VAAPFLTFFEASSALTIAAYLASLPCCQLPPPLLQRGSDEAAAVSNHRAQSFVSSQGRSRSPRLRRPSELPDLTAAPAQETRNNHLLFRLSDSPVVKHVLSPPLIGSHEPQTHASVRTIPAPPPRREIRLPTHTHRTRHPTLTHRSRLLLVERPFSHRDSPDRPRLGGPHRACHREHPRHRPREARSFGDGHATL